MSKGIALIALDILLPIVVFAPSGGSVGSRGASTPWPRGVSFRGRGSTWANSRLVPWVPGLGSGLNSFEGVGSLGTDLLELLK